MGALAAAYAALLRVLAAAAGALLGAVAALIVVDVGLRNLGFQPPAHTLSLTEYALLYATMLAAPWLVRERGHVYIELLTAAAPAPVRNALSRAVSASCTAICLVLVWYSLDVTVDDYARGAADIRSFDMPRWALVASVPIGFTLMAVEFLRFTLGRERMHTGEAGIHE